MKKYIFYVVFAFFITLGIMSAATLKYKVVAGDTWESIASKSNVTVQQLIDMNQPAVGSSITVPGTVVTPPPVTPPTTGEMRFNAYTTGYGYPDNTPKNSADICCGSLHSVAGGTGTYADPITIAVGHSITGGKDTLDYPAGTKFYIPNLRRYFIVEDACGDGNTPQNGPCHTGYQGNPWLDIWVGGVGFGSSGTIACEDSITATHLIVKNPLPLYSVVAGQIYNGSCSTQYGDTIQ